MKFFISLCLLFSTLICSAQCWNYPTTNNNLVLNGVTNTLNLNGNYSITGSGTVLGSSTFSNWNFLDLNGIMLINPLLDLTGVKKIYARGTIYLANVRADGHDTMFVNGNLGISDMTGIGLGNVILLAPTVPSLMVGSTTYFPGDLINGNILVQSCNSILPITLGSLK